MMDFGLNGKAAVVTGGSDGLGRATAVLLAREGAQVMICGRRADYVLESAQQLSAESGGTVLGVRADVSDAGDCENLISKATEAFGMVDILVNNAGASAAAKLETISDKDWQVDFDLKVMAAVRLTRLVVPLMRQQGGGSIVNAAMGGGKAPSAGQLPTSLSRAAGLNLTKSLANEFAADNIRVNAICIGLIKSAQWQRRAADGSLDDLYDSLAGRVPLGRVGEAGDYANLVAFLCSKLGTYITGTAINLDGGMCPVQ